MPDDAQEHEVKSSDHSSSELLIMLTVQINNIAEVLEAAQQASVELLAVSPKLFDAIVTMGKENAEIIDLLTNPNQKADNDES